MFSFCVLFHHKNAIIIFYGTVLSDCCNCSVGNNDWRIYSKSGDEGTVTISASNSKTITSIKVTFSTSNGGGLKLNGTALTSGTAVTVNTSSVSLSVPYKSNKTGHNT